MLVKKVSSFHSSVTLYIAITETVSIFIGSNIENKSLFWDILKREKTFEEILHEWGCQKICLFNFTFDFKHGCYKNYILLLTSIWGKTFFYTDTEATWYLCWNSKKCSLNNNEKTFLILCYLNLKSNMATIRHIIF